MPAFDPELAIAAIRRSPVEPPLSSGLYGSRATPSTFMSNAGRIPAHDRTERILEIRM
jgi:hypothetical protein